MTVLFWVALGGCSVIALSVGYAAIMMRWHSRQ